MVSVSDCMNALRDRGQCALVPFITAGDPDLGTTAKALQILDRNGADIIELGVPYSDPLADGPVIQAAATRALENGTRLDHVLDLLKKMTPELRSPIVLFTYYNPVLNRGIDTFFKDIAAAGAKGVVIPDLPLEEVELLLPAAKAAGIEIILLVAPTTPKDRLAAIAAQSEGFIYLVSVTGVTGMRTAVEGRVQEMLTELKGITDKPIGVGFGISQPSQAKQMVEWGADAVIVGSAFVKRLAEGSPEQGLAAVESLCRSLRGAIVES
jgi:tryptophan synthase alpha chain